MEATAHLNNAVDYNSNKNVFNKNYIIVLLGSMITLYTSGGVFHNFLDQQLNNTLLDKSICFNFAPVLAAAQMDNNTLTQPSPVQMSTETVFIYIFIVVLPMCPFIPFISTSSFSSLLVSNAKELFAMKPLLAETIFTHMLGQASAFASTEALQYFIVYPNQIFIDQCGIKTAQECESKFDSTKQQQLLISQVCNNAINDNQSLLSSSIHSMPQLTSVMLGASLVMFFYCYKQATHLYSTNITNKFYIVLKTKSCKIIVLLLLILMFALCFHFLTSHNAIKWTDVMYSFFSGILLQCVFIYVLKNKPQTITATQTTNIPMQPLNIEASFPMVPPNTPILKNKQ